MLTNILYYLHIKVTGISEKPDAYSAFLAFMFFARCRALQQATYSKEWPEGVRRCCKCVSKDYISKDYIMVALKPAWLCLR